MSLLLFGVNHPPVIQNVEVRIDDTERKITMTYDIEDAEDESITVGLKVLDKRRRYLNTSVHTIAGDIGENIKSGKQKEIVWSYPDTIRQIREYQVKLFAYDSYEIDIKEIVDQVDKQSLSDEIHKIYGARSHDAGKNLEQLHRVREHMSDSFERQGLYAFQQVAMIDGKKISNIIGLDEGYEGAHSYVLCAHYDTETVSPGADDNGSGVIGLMEAMRVLSNYNFKKSISFVGMDGEEIGHLGSRVYVMRAAQDSSAKIEGAINFDMIGYYSDKPRSQSLPYGYEMLYPEAAKTIVENDLRGDFILNAASESSARLGKTFDECAKQYVSDLNVVSLVAVGDYRFTEELNNSDHLQFWKGGYDALLISDTGPHRNKRLDTRKDVLKTLDFDFITKVVKTTVATLAELAEVKNGSEVFVELAVQ